MSSDHDAKGRADHRRFTPEDVRDIDDFLNPVSDRDEALSIVASRLGHIPLRGHEVRLYEPPERFCS